MLRLGPLFPRTGIILMGLILQDFRVQRVRRTRSGERTNGGQ